MINVYLTVGVVIAYLILTEPRFVEYVSILLNLFWVNINRLMMMAWMYPRLKFDQVYIYWKLRKVKKK